MTDDTHTDQLDASPAVAAMAFAFYEALLSGQLDDHLPTLAYAVKQRMAIYDRRKPPPKTPEMIASGHQVWAWVEGPTRPRWEVRGTGVILPPRSSGPRRQVSFTWWRQGPAPGIGEPYVDEYGKRWIVIESDTRIPQHIVAEEDT